jgi:hypothetical protein
MRTRILVMIVFAVLAGTAGYGVRTALNSTTQEQRPAYTIVWRVTEYYPDGTNRPRYLETRQVSASGKWHTVKNGGDTNEESFGEPGKGVFIKGRQKMYFVSEYTAPPPVLTEEKLLNSPTRRLWFRQVIVRAPAQSFTRCQPSGVKYSKQYSPTTQLGPK